MMKLTYTNRKFTAVWMVPLMLAVTISCTHGGGSRSSEILFDTIAVEKAIPLLQENDTTLPHAEVSLSFTYPVKFRDEESVARLQQIFQGTFFGETRFDSMSPREAVDRYLQEYSSRYSSLSNSYYEDKARLEGETPVWYWYSLHNSNKILFSSDSLLSYAVEYSDYEGGAHGSYRILYTNIDLQRMTTLSEEDLFLPGYYNPLTEKILQSLMESYSVDEPDSLLQKGFFTIEDIVPNNNFWLNEEGIHYAYNQYEIAPYAMGVIHVTVPFSALSDIMLPDGILTNYLIKGEQ